MVFAELNTLYRGADPLTNPESNIVRRRALLSEQDNPSRSWLGWMGSLALTVGGEWSIGALWGIDAYITHHIKKYREIQANELLTNSNLGSNELWGNLLDQLIINPYLDNKLERIEKDNRYPEVVRRLVKTLQSYLIVTDIFGQRVTQQSEQQKRTGERGGKLIQLWSKIDRERTSYGKIQGEHSLTAALANESNEIKRREIFFALHKDLPTKLKLWRSLHHNRHRQLSISGKTWNQAIESKLDYKANNLLNIHKLGTEISPILNDRLKARNGSLRVLNTIDMHYAWNHAYIKNILDKAGVTLGENIDIDGMFYQIMEMMGLQDFYDNYAVVSRSKSLDRAISLDSPMKVGIHIDERLGLHATLDKVHELGHFIEMTLTHVMLPGMFRLNMNGSVGTEIVAMLVQFAAYCELGEGKLSNFGIKFNDGRERGIDRILGALQGSLLRTEFEENIYTQGFKWDIDNISEIDSLIKKKYGLTQLHPDEWANDMRLVRYKGYDLNYIFAILGAMQMYEYAECNFGGLFNVEAGLWLADNYCKYGDAISWRDKIKLATGEELNPEYLLTAMRGMDWKTYYQKRVKEVKLNSATNN